MGGRPATKALLLLAVLSLVGPFQAEASTIDWSDYDKTIPPHRGINVSVSLYVNSLEVPLDSTTGEIIASIYLKLSWYDPRIPLPRWQKEKIQYDGLEKSIYLPDVFIKNAKEVSDQSLVKENLLTTVFSDKRVWFSKTYSVKLRCPMSVQKFPYDTQKCPIMIESFGYTTERVDLHFANQPIDFDMTVVIREYTLQDVELTGCSQEYSTGSYPCLQYNFKLSRDSGWFIGRSWLPNVLLVIVSWFGFWMKPGVSRVLLGLGILVLLGVHDLINQERLPKIVQQVNYLTAYDVWNRGCWWLVALSLLEFVTVHCLLEAGKACNLACCRGLCDKTRNIAIPIDNLDEGQQSQTPDKSENNRKPKALLVADRVMAVLIPVIFLILNIAVWRMSA